MDEIQTQIVSAVKEDPYSWFARMREELPNFKRVRSIPVEYLLGDIIYGVKNLPITFTPAA